MRRIVEFILITICATGLIVIVTLSAIASFCLNLGKQQHSRKYPKYLEEIDGLFKVKSSYLQDDVNLNEDSGKYIYIDVYREWYTYNV